MPSEERSLGAGRERVNAERVWNELALCVGSIASDPSGGEGPARLAAFAVQHVGAARAIVLGRKPDAASFMAHGSAGLDVVEDRAALLEYARRLAGWVERTRVPLVIGDVPGDARFHPAPGQVMTAVALPLRSDQEFLGAFVILDEQAITADSAGNEREVLLLCLAHLAAMSIDRGRARARWRDLAQDLEQSERQVVETDRLLAAGQMRDELAREMIDTLHGMGGLTDQVLRSLEPDDPRRSVLERLVEETARLGRAIRGSTELARPAQVLEPDTLNRIMSETLALVREEIVEGRVELTQRLGASLPPLVLDADLMRRVFLNLVRAGVRNATPGGRVKVETKRRGETIEVLVAADGERRAGEALDVLWAVFGDEDASGDLRLGLSRHLLLDRGISLRSRRTREWPFALALLVPIAPNQDRRRGRRDRRRTSTP